MALTQVFPDFQLNEGALGKEEVVPRSRAPRRVEFRSGADLTSVIGDVMQFRSVVLDAAPGAGKTVKFPRELAKVTGGLVVHVLPFDHAAVATYTFVSKADSGVSVVLALDPASAWPKTGWVITSAACLVAKWMTRGGIQMPECYLLHDESHESGAASAALRTFGPVASGVLSYVAMSATSQPEGARRMETKGKVYEQAYAPGAFRNPWSVEEDGAPWAVSGLEGHILIFEDDPKRAQDLVQAYNYNGVNAYRLTSRTGRKEFEGVMNAISDEHSVRLSALIVDSTYRSSHTLPVAHVVDSGEVRRVVVGEDGLPFVHTRSIYEFERVQSAARGGRMDGQVTQYWRPIANLEKVLCDLEQVDVEAFALICRLLGYRPPSYCAAAKMASGKIPLDVVESLNGPLPLACLPESRLRDVAIASVEAVSKVPMGFAEGSGALDSHETRVSESSVKLGGAFDFSASFDVLRGMLASPPETEKLDFGQYYCAEGVVNTEVACFAFPDGAQSVKRVLAHDKSRAVHFGWSPHVRSVAVNALVHAHNLELVELKALTRALGEVRSQSGSKDRRATREWAVNCAERLANLGSQVEASLGLMQVVAEGFCTLRVCENLFGDEEMQVCRYYLSNFRAIPDSSSSDSSAEIGRVREWATSAVVDVDGLGPVYRLGESRLDRVDRPSPPKLLRYFSGYPRVTTKKVLMIPSPGTGDGSSSSGASVRLEEVPVRYRRPRGW